MIWLLLAGCDPYHAWPAPADAFPWVYTPQDDLQPYEEVRWETGDWDPVADPGLAAMYLLKAANHRPGAPDEVLAHFDAVRPALPPLGDGLRLSFVGDAMWIDGNYTAFAADVAHLLDGDLRLGNLETPTDDDQPTGAGALGLYAFNAPSALIDGLPLDLVQVDNNHTLDAGDEGIEATLAALDARGVAWTGVDEHRTVTVGGLDVAVLSYTWGLNVRDVVSAHELFVVPFGAPDYPDLSAIEADLAATSADVVVVMVHWGYEYEYYPDPRFLQLGRELVSLGADVVVGSGPHVAQPPELCEVNRPEVVPGVGTCSVRSRDGVPRTAAILYSLGNFQSMMPTTPCEVGLVATVSIADRTVTGLGWSAVANVNGPALVPLDTLTDPDHVAESARLDAHLGAGWRRP